MPIFYTDNIDSQNVGITGSFLLSGSLTVTGSLNTGVSLTGSLFGTASFASTLVSASFITASNVFGPFGANSAISSSVSISSSFSLDADAAADGYPIMPLIYNDLGSPVKFENYSYFGVNQLTTQTTINTAYLRLMPVYIPVSSSISGVLFYPITAGVYTADNYNGAVLYSYSAGTLTAVVSSSNDGNLWKSGAVAVTKSFASTYNAAPGLYYVGMYFNWSAVTTNPALARIYATGPTPADVARMDFTNSARLTYNTAGTTFTTASLNSISVSTLTSTVDTSTIYVGLY